MTESVLNIIEIVFWASGLGVLYAYIGYPLLIRLAASTWGRERPHARTRLVSLPHVTVLIVAHNAAEHLQERLENLFASDYSSELLDVVIASDGSSDETVAIARRFPDPRVRVIAYTRRRGKAATLVDTMNSIDSPVVVFTDASTKFERGSLKALVSPFQDPSVGLVSGSCKFVDATGALTESMYWRAESRLRQYESQLGITLGASGAIYAIRRKYFVPTHRPVINDDLVLPLLVRLTHRCQMVLEPAAIAYVKTSPRFSSEFGRRVRIGIGAFQCLNALRGVWSWRNRWSLFALLSHKVARWACPFWMLAALISNLCLTSKPYYQWTLVAQVVFYGMATIGILGLCSETDLSSRPVRVARTLGSFVAMNVALALGICRWIIQPSTVTWVPTSRTRWNTECNNKMKQAA
jgi:cellulose synthase/poly-beta-1,6-N-acetylglucosamine synthase-like glycosyltransferase